MATGWLKIEKTLPDKPEVILLAELLGISPDAVVGKLIRFWSWFDDHTKDGYAPSVTKVTLDRITGMPEFCNSMISVGWMKDRKGVVSLPSFEKHNSETAKARALTLNRVHKKRNGENVTEALQGLLLSTSSSNNSSVSKKDIECLYAAYPRKIGKAKAMKEIAKALRDTPLETLMEAVQAFAKSDSGRAGQYCPHPATWFSQRRWEDDREQWNDRKPGTPRIGAGQRYDPNATTEDDCVGRI